MASCNEVTILNSQQVDFVIACTNGNARQIQRLLQQPTVDPSCSGNNTAISIAVINNHIDVVQLLLADQRVDPTYRYDNLICQAAQRGYTELVEMLLADGRINPTAYQYQAIRDASEKLYSTIVALLLADHRLDVVQLVTRYQHEQHLINYIVYFGYMTREEVATYKTLQQQGFF